jgi:hypothetical protein
MFGFLIGWGVFWLILWAIMLILGVLVKSDGMLGWGAAGTILSMVFLMSVMVGRLAAGI